MKILTNLWREEMNEIISTIFRIYLSQLQIYQRFFQYIDVSTRDIDLSTNNDKKRMLQNEHPLSIY
ncbi:hypothetical protein CN402_13345 [Bacillus sp. AFS015896]|nr:hypothetical protein CN476_26600 [Bacillus cereus]PFA60752.1 hypothetical protein CN402_13345 [Bacillus sp. AFS015896]PGX07465.1 hypothetical protein COE07_22270 [Bacillus sp. AFS033286]PGZ76799.1 hypothetical protein COE49_00715 [Bacillus sp. AFS029637]